MAILVTGGAGYIGSHVVHALHDRHERVIILDDLSTGFRSSVPSDVALTQGDVGDKILLRSIIDRYQVSEVFHFAAKTVVPDSITRPLDYYETNAAKTRNLLEVIAETGVRHVVFSSTAAVYGNGSGVPVSEDTPPQPMSPYGTSKLMSEWMLRDVAAAHGFSSVALRYFNVAGADPQGRTGQSTSRATHLVKVAVQAALGLRTGVEVFGTDFPTRDGTCVRDYVHVADLVDAHLAALRYLRGGGASTALNCGYGFGYSVLEVLEAVKRVSGVDFPVRPTRRRNGDPAIIVAKADRIRRQLGWRPHYADLDTIVTHALAWERDLQERSRQSVRPQATVFRAGSRAGPRADVLSLVGAVSGRCAATER